MADEDKTYCGSEDRDHVDARSGNMITRLASKLAVTEDDIRDAAEQVGKDPSKIEAFFKDKQNSY